MPDFTQAAEYPAASPEAPPFKLGHSIDDNSVRHLPCRECPEMVLDTTPQAAKLEGCGSETD